MTNSSSNQTLAQSLNMAQQQHLLNHEHPSPTHSRSYASLHHPQQQNMLNNMVLSEKVTATSTDCLEMSDVIPAAAAGQSEHYIYVTYPPELKRRLLERYYLE